MFDAEKAKLEEMRARFDEEFGARSAHARQSGEAYLAGLDEFVRGYYDSPAVDPNITHADTTGTIRRAEEYIDWVTAEQKRVRRAIIDIS